MLFSASGDLAVSCAPCDAGKMSCRVFRRDSEESELVELPETATDLALAGTKAVFCVNESLLVLDLIDKKFEKLDAMVGPVALEKDPFGESRFLVRDRNRAVFACELGESISVKKLYEDVDDLAVSEDMIVLKRGRNVQCFSRTESDFLPFFERTFGSEFAVFCEKRKLLAVTASEILESLDTTDGRQGDSEHVVHVWKPAIIQTSERAISYQGHRYELQFPIMGAAHGHEYIVVWKSWDEKPVFVPVFKETSGNQTMNNMEAVANSFIADSMKLVKANDARMMKRVQEMSEKLKSSLTLVEERLANLEHKFERAFK